MSQQFILSKAGNAAQARLKDIIVSSKYSSPKIYTLGNPPHAGNIFINWSSSLAKAYGTTTLIDSFPHGFQYVPSVFATFNFQNSSNQLDGMMPFSYGAIGVITIDTDATNVNVKYFSTDLANTTVIPTFNMVIRYYLMVDPGE